MNKIRPTRSREEVAAEVAALKTPIGVRALARICGLTKATVLHDVCLGKFPIECVIRVRHVYRIHPSGILPYYDQLMGWTNG